MAFNNISSLNSVSDIMMNMIGGNNMNNFNNNNNNMNMNKMNNNNNNNMNNNNNNNNMNNNNNNMNNSNNNNNNNLMFLQAMQQLQQQQQQLSNNLMQQQQQLNNDDNNGIQPPLKKLKMMMGMVDNDNNDVHHQQQSHHQDFNNSNNNLNMNNINIHNNNGLMGENGNGKRSVRFIEDSYVIPHPSTSTSDTWYDQNEYAVMRNDAIQMADIIRNAHQLSGTIANLDPSQCYTRGLEKEILGREQFNKGRIMSSKRVVRVILRLQKFQRQKNNGQLNADSIRDVYMQISHDSCKQATELGSFDFQEAKNAYFGI